MSAREGEVWGSIRTEVGPGRLPVLTAFFRPHLGEPSVCIGTKVFNTAEEAEAFLHDYARKYKAGEVGKFS